MKKYIITLCVLCFFSCKKELKNTKLSGAVFGTSYSVIYDSEINYEKQFDSLFYVINKSLSTYQVNSDISKLNRNEFVEVDEHFINVYEASKEIYNETIGVFDPTIGAVVNAWDFGPEGKVIGLDSLKIDSLMLSVGLNKLQRIQNKITKPKGTFIDFNAIAKGYGVDVIAAFLESKSINNYLVEMGGEIHCKGKNIESLKPWTVGIDKPRFDGIQNTNDYFSAVSLGDESMATSGSYRKYKVDNNGNRYAHIIDAKTGYPSKSNILRVSVITKDCMVADAYATAFQAMEIDNVKAFLQTHPELKVLIIFENENNEFETLALNNFPE